MSVNSVTTNSYWNYARRIGNVYLHTTFGTGAEEFMSSMDKSIFGKRPANTPWYQPYKGADWSNFWTKFKNAFKDVEKHEAAVRKANGGSYWKSFTSQLSSTPELFKKEWIAGGKAAKAAGKSQFWGKLCGANKALMKRMPLIGGIIMVATQIPNIIKAFTADGKDEKTGVVDPRKAGGIATGLLETGKAIAKVGIDTAGFVIGQSLIPIPFVGGMIGCMVSSFLGEKLLGKSFSDKVDEIDGKQSKLPSWTPYIGQSGTPGFNGNYNFVAPQSAYTPEQLMQMKMHLDRIS